MPRLRIRDPDGTTREVTLEDELTIGRLEESGLQLASGGVSRRHAALTVDGDGTIWLEDLGSAHGTFVDGERVEARSPLTPGQKIHIGDYELELVRERPARPASAPRPVRRAGPGSALGRPESEDGEDRTGMLQRGASGRPRALPAGSGKGAGPGALARRPASPINQAPRGPHLRGATGPWLNRHYPLKGLMVVGREQGVGIFVDDASVSRQHAELIAGPEGVSARDLGSANGSVLNDQPLGAEPVVLEEGDRLMFGGVEFTFSTGEEIARALPVRQRPGRPARRSAAALQAQQAEAASPERRRKVLVGASVLGGVLLIAMVAAFVQDASSVPGPDRDLQRRAATPQTPQQRLEALLSECRTYASLDLGNPDWIQAEKACNAALDLDPIHEEAVGLMKRISLEKEAFELFTQAERALHRNDEEQALELFRKISRESGYFQRARTRVTEALEEVKKRLLQDCKAYVRNGKWQAAAATCEKHMVLACPSIPREELVPPVGYTLSLRPRRGRNEWKPQNADFLRFLNARQRAGLGDQPWECPPSDILVVEVEENSPKKIIEAELAKRYQDKTVRRAMLEYWEGKAGEAGALLQKVRNSVEKAALHGEVDQLKRHVDNVFQLYQNGQAALQEDDPERAAPSFQEALELDEKLMRDPFFRDQPSFYRSGMQKDLASSAYQRGRFWADRNNPRRGCSVWKLGFTFFSGNIDLNKAVRYCSELALKALKDASSCDALPEVLDLAVDGDGVRERTEARKTELGCL